MNKAKEYLLKDHSNIHHSDDAYVSEGVYDGNRFLLDRALEIAYIEGQLKVINDSEGCKASIRELNFRLNQLIND